MKTIKIKLNIVSLFCFGLLGLQAQTVRDIDGNIYKTVTIGTQVWIAENLKTTKFNDGTVIALVTSDKAWGELTTPARCWYDNVANSYKNTYGALYNWFVIETNKLCPLGWHVFSREEMKTLTTYLGGESVAGGKLKESGITHWENPNEGATNETGFTALPGGDRGALGTFSSMGYDCRWWTSTEYSISTKAYSLYLSYRYVKSVTAFECEKQNGYYVRCVKDN
jgi:uncharacterized protein (TIGR02145 family)